MVKLFADCADVETMLRLNADQRIAGFTTNPSLLKIAGVTDYREFAARVLEAISDKPISFEVIADDMQGIDIQARMIGKWGRNVFVKIPITNTKGESCIDLIRRIAMSGVRINVTAVMTIEQIYQAVKALGDGPGIVSIFAGRIADTGENPIPYLTKGLVDAAHTQVEILWASPREVYNVYQADRIGCDIITLTPELLAKYFELQGRDLAAHSLETVRMFARDASQAGLRL